MHIGNSQTQSYGYNQNVNVANKNDSSNSFNNYLEKEDLKNIKIINKNLISILEKNNAFSSLSKEEETLFRYVLEDDKISNEFSRICTRRRYKSNFYERWKIWKWKLSTK